MMVILLLIIMAVPAYGYQSNYQQWNHQDTRNNIQSGYANNGSEDTWLGMLDPFNAWLLSYTGDPVIQQLSQQGLAQTIAYGMSSVLSANPKKVNNNIAKMVGSSLPKSDIAESIVKTFSSKGYADTIVDGATNIISSNWSTGHTDYNMVTLMAVMSDVSETDSNPNGFFVADSQTRKTIANLAYASQLFLEKDNVFSIRQPVVFNATTYPYAVDFTTGRWNYSQPPVPVSLWGYTLNVPIGAITFVPYEEASVLDYVSFNITATSGERVTVQSSALFGERPNGVASCGVNTKVNTHIYNPSAMGTGLWASNGFGLVFGDCPMVPDYVRVVHGEGTPCTNGTYIVYKNETDGLLSFVIPSLAYGNWVVKPAGGFLNDRTIARQQCIESLTGPKNALLDIEQPPVSPISIGYFEECQAFVTDNSTGNSVQVVIEYTGPNARITPENPVSDYSQLVSCVSGANTPETACFDPGLSRSIVNVCKEYLSTSSNLDNSSTYNAIISGNVLLQQRAASQVVQTPTSTYIPDIVGSPTAYGAITALVAAVAATIALNANKIMTRIQVTRPTRKFSHRMQVCLTMLIVLFSVIFAQLPLVILCVQAVKLDGQTGYQYIPDFTTTTDPSGNNVFLIMQVSAVQLKYNVPIIWLYPTVLSLSVAICLSMCIVMYKSL